MATHVVHASQDGQLQLLERARLGDLLRAAQRAGRCVLDVGKHDPAVADGAVEGESDAPRAFEMPSKADGEFLRGVSLAGEDLRPDLLMPSDGYRELADHASSQAGPAGLVT